MPGFAKFLVFLNVLMAGVFLVLATLSFNARRPWAYQVFLAELAQDGLPLDESDPGLRRVEVPLYADLDNDAILRDVFPKAEKIVKTQEEEVLRLKKEVSAELDKVKDDERELRDAFRRLILPLTLTLEERDYWLGRIVDKDTDLPKLKEDFLREFFDRALIKEDAEAKPEESDWLYRARPEIYKNEKYIKLTRREKIAHLLYNLSPSPQAHTRTMHVIGLKNYINEAELQAARLRDMALRTRMAMVDERALFEMEYQRLQQRILTLLEELEAKKLYLADKTGVRDRTRELVKIREEDKKTLVAQTAETETALGAALADQMSVETQLFETQKRLGDLQAKTEMLQRYIGRLEGVPGRN